jgi:3-phenylpropionate/cinnamic acid dioxygenase small subunit
MIPAANNASLASAGDLRQEVDDFYRREVLLLQDRRYREWLELMDPGIRYRVPVTTSTANGFVMHDDELGYYDENLELLQARVAKLESRHSWVEHPPSRLRYFVQVLEASRGEDGILTARSNVMLLQYRWNMEQHFSGERTDTLLDTDGGLRLRERRVVLDRQVLGQQGLSVFF